MFSIRFDVHVHEHVTSVFDAIMNVVLSITEKNLHLEKSRWPFE